MTTRVNRLRGSRLHRVLLLLLLATASCGRTPEGMVWVHRTGWHVLPKSFILDDMKAPAIVGQLAIYCGGAGSSRKAHMGVLRLSDGKLMSRHDVGSCFERVMVSDFTAISLGHQDDFISLVSIDAFSGRLLFHLKLPRSFQYQDPVVHDGFVYIARSDSVWIIGARSGLVRRIATPEYDPSRPVHVWMVGDSSRLLLGVRRSVYLVHTDSADSTDFKPLVQLPDEFRYPDRLTLRGNALYIADRGRGGSVGKFSLVDGHLIWKFTDMPTDAPTIAEGLAILPNSFGYVALDDSTGAERWRTRGEITFFRPTYSEGMLYAQDNDAVIRMNAHTGKVTMRWAARAEVVDQPVVAGNLLLFGNALGELYAVKIR